MSAVPHATTHGSREASGHLHGSKQLQIRLWPVAISPSCELNIFLVLCWASPAIAHVYPAPKCTPSFAETHYTSCYAVPLYFSPVRLGSDLLVDGCLTDCTPISGLGPNVDLARVLVLTVNDEQHLDADFQVGGVQSTA